MRSATFETGLTLGSTDNTSLDLDNSGYHENLIQYNSLLLYRAFQNSKYLTWAALRLRHTGGVIRQRGAIFRFSLTNNVDPHGLCFSNI
jgi:hypothetical protein